MRVTLATTACEAGGVVRHMLDLGQALQARGHPVRFAAPGVATRPLEQATAVGLSCLELESLSPDSGVLHVHLSDTYDWAGTKLLMRSRVQRWSTRVLTEHLPRTNASDPALMPNDGRRAGAALAKKILKRAQLASVDRVIVVSAGSAAFMSARYRVPLRRFDVIRNALPGTEVAVAPPVGDGPLRVLAVGALITQKGHDVLIEAARISRRPWRVSIAGTGPTQTRVRLERAAAEVDGDRVKLLGWCDDMDAVISQHDVVCMPSRWEAFPYAALEALAQGRALVSTDVDGLAEIVEEGETGLLVAPDDPAALSAALDRLDDDRQLVMEMASAGPSSVAGRFPFDLMVEDTLAVYARHR